MGSTAEALLFEQMTAPVWCAVAGSRGGCPRVHYVVLWVEGCTDLEQFGYGLGASLAGTEPRQVLYSTLGLICLFFHNSLLEEYQMF